LTIDWVNPEAPWPHLEKLDEVTRASGHVLRARLPVYPEYLNDEWIDPALLPAALLAATDDGYAAIPDAVNINMPVIR
jgi:FO synthase